MEKFIERLKELRVDKNISKRQLAKEIGVSHTTVGRWEEGLISPTLENILSLCSFFKCSADFLIGLED